MRQEGSRTQGPKGIGGWLLLFVVGQVLSLILNVRNALDLSKFSQDAWSLGDHVSLYRPLIVIEELCTVLLCVGGVVGLILLIRKKPQTPRFYFDYLVFVAGFGLLEIGGMALLLPRLAAFIHASGGSTEALIQDQSALNATELQQIAYGLVWLLYWRKSRRVASTFISSEGNPS